MSKISVMFVCTENICRSPMAQAIMKQRLRERNLHKSVEVSSAGTHASQPGHKPDLRAVKITSRAGIKMSGIKARKIKETDFYKFDYILAMDKDNLEYLLTICPGECSHKISLVLKNAPNAEKQEVPDPYFGSEAGFQKVFELLDEGVIGWINTLV